MDKKELFEHVDVMAEEEEVEREIGNVLRVMGYEPGSSIWTRNMHCWKQRRTSNPSYYKKFVSMD